jgi:hypothetical protein
MKAIILILCHGMGSDFNTKERLAAQTGLANVWLRLKNYTERLTELEWHPFSLIQRGRACVWAQVLGHPDVPLSGMIYSHNAKALVPWKGSGDDDASFKKSCALLVEFWEGVTRTRYEAVSSSVQEFGATMCLWGTQYWMFPFASITIEAPSPFATAQEWKEFL